MLQHPPPELFFPIIKTLVQATFFSCQPFQFYFILSDVLIIVFFSLQPISNADFIVPVEIDGTIHQVRNQS